MYITIIVWSQILHSWVFFMYCSDNINMWSDWNGTMCWMPLALYGKKNMQISAAHKWKHWFNPIWGRIVFNARDFSDLAYSLYIAQVRIFAISNSMMVWSNPDYLSKCNIKVQDGIIYQVLPEIELNDKCFYHLQRFQHTNAQSAVLLVCKSIL